MEISFYLKRSNAKTETVIFARISYDGNSFKYYTEEKISPKFWNTKTRKAQETNKFPEYPEFNTRLSNISTDIRNVIRTFKNDNHAKIPSIAILKGLLDKKIRTQGPKTDTPKTLIGFFDNIIKQTKNGGRVQIKTGKPYSNATIQIYQNTLNRLMAFQTTRKRVIDFDTIDLEFYTDFIEYLSKRLKLTTNTIGKDIKTLKTILNEAIERGIIVNSQFKSKKFSTTSERTDSIYLNEKEIKAIEKLKLSDNSRLDNVRDLFLIGCYTGLRFSDFSILKPDQLINGFIEIKAQTKTGYPVVIPIHPTVNKIISKYNGELPRSITNQKTNEYLKEIGKEIDSLKENTSKTITKGGLKVITSFKKWELLTTHTARRSFATNEYLAGTPTITIMAITGHRNEKAFLTYIKLTPYEHAKVLKKQWDQRNNLMAV